MKAIFVCVLAVSLAACGSGGGSGQKSTTSAPVAPVQSSLISVVIPPAFADDQAASISVTITNKATKVSSTKTKTPGSSAVSFPSVDAGDYDIAVSAATGNVEFAKGSTTATVSGPQTSVQAQLTYTKGSLLVEPILEPQGPTQQNLGGKYKVTARMSGCIKNDFTDSFGSTDADLTLSVSGSTLTANLELFPKPTIKFDAGVSPGQNFVTGSGTFQSSDFTSGTIIIDKLVQLEQSSVFISATLQSTCETKIDLTGFRVSN